MKMAFQRCFLQLTKQYMSRNLYQPAIRQTCCQMYHNYGTENPRKFSERHEWVVVENNIGTVGISKYAQESLGDVVFAQLPEPDTEVQEGDECGALESVKAASEIYSPVSGTITQKNIEVESKPALINTSYYDKGWLFKVKLTNPEELKQLMTEEQYEMFLKSDADKDDKEKEKEKQTDT